MLDTGNEIGNRENVVFQFLVFVYFLKIKLGRRRKKKREKTNRIESKIGGEKLILFVLANHYLNERKVLKMMTIKSSVYLFVYVSICISVHISYSSICV